MKKLLLSILSIGCAMSALADGATNPVSSGIYAANIVTNAQIQASTKAGF